MTGLTVLLLVYILFWDGTPAPEVTCSVSIGIAEPTKAKEIELLELSIEHTLACDE